MDPATAGLVLTGLKTLRELARDRKDAETVEKVMELQVQISEIMSENQALAMENARLKEQLAKREAVEVREDGAVWRKSDIPSHSFGGFCPECFSDGGKLIKLVSHPDGSRPTRNCGVCKFYASGRWWA